MGVKALAHDLKGHMAKWPWANYVCIKQNISEGTELEENNQMFPFSMKKKMIKLQEYERDKEGKEFGQQEKIHFHTPVSQG